MLYSPQLPTSPVALTPWVQPQKQQKDLGLFPSKQFSITVIQAYTPTTNAEEAEVE